ncbi:MAG: acetyl-CoA carboxylase carboxyltransferase subunit alpha, partial [Gammaproteobacteria bacterium]|nr:acetyl-CoA carboxylase carboxyltransferase subunit alpha [Gammaproteobacteria bacterium]
MRDYLDFELPLKEIQLAINETSNEKDNLNKNVLKKISKLQSDYNTLEKKIFKQLTPIQVLQLARHPNRPHSITFINQIFTDFQTLHGNRTGADCPTTITGIGYLDDYPVMVIAQEIGFELEQRIKNNFGMMSPSGYQKAQRAMNLAEKFQIPIITLIDTPGAYPGVKAEEDNQSGAIAENLKLMAELKTPIINCIIGEGCSGGALGIGMGDYTFMLQYASFSVISPEGCASILWKTAEKKDLAAKEMKLCATDLIKLNLIDEIIEEGLGGAHQNPKDTFKNLKEKLIETVAASLKIKKENLLKNRFD